MNQRIPGLLRVMFASGGLLLWLAFCPGCTSAKARTPVVFRVMTYNIHHGEGLDGKVDLARIAELIRRTRADIVALQEVDKGVERTQRRDLPAELALLTGMTCVFSNNFHYQGGEYGNAVLTRFPVLAATNLHYQMLRTGEQRGLLQLELELGKHRLWFMNTHIDYRPDDSERWQNLAEIKTVVEQHAGKPIILCGDFNDTPGKRVYVRLAEIFGDSWELAGQGDGFTIPAGKPTKRIDYVWVSRGSPYVPVSAAVVSSEASDHLPMVVEFRGE